MGQFRSGKSHAAQLTGNHRFDRCNIENLNPSDPCDLNGQSIDDDPLFEDASTGNFQLTCGSPSLDKVTDTGLLDTFPLNVNQVSIPTNFQVPDAAESKRTVRAGYRDHGAYELQPTPSCAGDVAPLACRDYLINIDDLVLVVTWWGPCPEDGYCPADTVATWGVVDIDDLVAVITGWGSCPGHGGGSEPVPQSVSDCLNWYPIGSAKLQACLESIQLRGQ